MRAYSFSTSSYFAGNGAARPLCTHAVLETKVAIAVPDPRTQIRRMNTDQNSKKRDETAEDETGAEQEEDETARDRRSDSRGKSPNLP